MAASQYSIWYGAGWNNMGRAAGVCASFVVAGRCLAGGLSDGAWPRIRHLCCCHTPFIHIMQIQILTRCFLSHVASFQIVTNRTAKLVFTHNAWGSSIHTQMFARSRALTMCLFILTLSLSLSSSARSDRSQNKTRFSCFIAARADGWLFGKRIVSVDVGVSA